MKNFIAALLVVAAPAVAAAEDCATLDHLSALYEVRGAIIRGESSYTTDGIVDRYIDQLRVPVGNGRFRWVKYERPAGDGPELKKVHEVHAVQGSGSDTFEASDGQVYQVRVVVPRKRSLFNGNNAVYVGRVHIDYEVEGRQLSKDLDVEAWMSPDTSRTIDLRAIADHAHATLEASAEAKHAKEAVVELHFDEAVPRDDPENPAYDQIVALRRLRSDTSPLHVDDEIATLERRLFPSASPLPLAQIINDLKRADSLMRSSKAKDQEQGERLLHDALRALH